MPKLQTVSRDLSLLWPYPTPHSLSLSLPPSLACGSSPLSSLSPEPQAPVDNVRTVNVSVGGVGARRGHEEMDRVVAVLAKADWRPLGGRIASRGHDRKGGTAGRTREGEREESEREREGKREDR